MMNKRPMKEDMHQGSNSHWSDLPLPLLELILKRLPAQDYFRFGAVCYSWRNAEKHQFYSPASQLPWLMLRQASHDFTWFDKRRFFNISEKRIHKRNIPEILLHASVLSTCQEWLKTNGKFLLTPFNNVLFLPTPTDPDGILIVSNATEWGFTSFFYYRLKDLKFGERYCKTYYCKTRVHGRFISCKGKLYGLDMKYNLVVVDLLHGHHVDEDEDEILEMIEIPQLFHWSDSILLVESCGEILLVRVRGGKRHHMEPEEYSFEVYHANLSRMEWEKIENLGDRILFLSEYGISISVSAAEAGGRGNCVYYIPKHISRKWLEFEFGSGKPPEVHSIDGYDDGDIEKFWVTPSF
ncbi:hypothetical protein MRB53_032400 [Persea americana]|uniref:Uncharacterized protein n=1 Tax=Persea americana TaxID=3435 RepID=A0ACC2KS89_PERAE|nr:hypothetical protein MRB53_032400 [Persea americana]